MPEITEQNIDQEIERNNRRATMLQRHIDLFTTKKQKITNNIVLLTQKKEKILKDKIK